MKEGIEMLTLLFVICMFIVLGKLSMLALHGVWGLTKVLFTIIFLPVILLGLVFKGLIVIALPVLIVFGVAAWLSGAAGKNIRP